MKESLREKIIEFAQQQAQWINGGEFEKLALREGYKPSNASRRCRELENEHKFFKRLNKKGFVEYRYNDQSEPKGPKIIHNKDTQPSLLRVRYPMR